MFSVTGYDTDEDSFRQMMINGSRELGKRIQLVSEIEAIDQTHPTSDSEGSRYVDVVSRFFDLSPRDLTGNSRLHHIVDARFCVTALLRKRGWTQREIGKVLGNRERTSIRHFLNWADLYRKRNPRVQVFLELTSTNPE